MCHTKLQRQFVQLLCQLAHMWALALLSSGRHERQQRKCMRVDVRTVKMSLWNRSYRD